LTPSRSTGSDSTMLDSSRKYFKVGRCVLIMNNKLTYFIQSKTEKTLNEWQSSIFNTPVRQLQKAWKSKSLRHQQKPNPLISLWQSVMIRYTNIINASSPFSFKSELKATAGKYRICIPVYMGL